MEDDLNGGRPQCSIVHIETLEKNTYSTCILKVKSLTMMTVRQSFGEVHSVGGTVVTNNITLVSTLPV